jgi:hypothetical protein
MKRLILVFFLTLILVGQDISSMGKKKDKNAIDAGIGMTFIDGKSYTTFNISPDLSFGKWGFGLNVELMFDNAEGFEFRKDQYEGGAGWLRLIRYIRYGQKGSDVYARVGSIDNGVLGNGFLMNHYTNAADLDNQKIGLVLDLDFEDFGFESMYTNVNKPEILGFRGYYRPFSKLKIPVLSSLEIGGTYTTDLNSNPNKQIIVSATNDSTVNTNNIAMFGADLGLHLIKTDFFRWKVYYDFGKIVDYGSGQAIGTSMIVPKIGGLLEMGAKYERRMLGDEFAPVLFNTMYDKQKSQVSIHQYIASQKEISGNFFELSASLLNTVFLTGQWQKLDEPENTEGKTENGTFFADLTVAADIPFELSGRFVKTGIDGLGDLGLDEKALAEIELGYQINTFIFASFVYQYTWAEDLDEDGKGTGKYKSQKRMIPQISFRYNF